MRGDAGDAGKTQTLQGHSPVKDLGHYCKRSVKLSTEILNKNMIDIKFLF